MKAFILLVTTIFLIWPVEETYAQVSRGFQFIESSAGMNYPSWESGMTELEFADINRDGFTDILSIGDHGSPHTGAQEHGIMVWFGDGKGNWSAQMTGDFGYGGIAVGDVNNDGHWDVGYGMHHDYSSTDLGDQKMEVALGDGTGVNWIPWDDGLATNGESWGMFGTDFADIDNDGDLDIGSNSFGSGDGVHIYRNNGNGTWQQSFGFFAGNSEMRLLFGDVNNDGNPDLVVSNEAGTVWMGDGTGTFTPADYNLPSYGWPVMGPDLGDVNKDGAMDLAFVNLYGGVFVWTFDPSTLQWINISGTLPASGNYQECQLCDFDRDGTLDIAAFGNAQLTIWKGTVSSPLSVEWSQQMTMTTSNNGDCNAFRAGGDVDRNGFPDITLVEKVGNWPNDRNKLKCFKEQSPFLKANIDAVFPRGKEKFKQGCVGFIDWISAVPDTSTAGVRIEYSLQGSSGPWFTLTESSENSGRFQWILPMTISSNNCFIRLTLMEGGDTLTALTPEAFTILGSAGLIADFMADSTDVTVNQTVQFTDLSLGLVTSWQWDFDHDGIIDATERNPEWQYNAPGTYTVKLTVSDGNSGDSKTRIGYITVHPPVAADPILTTPVDFYLYPNPVSDQLTIITGNSSGAVTRVICFDIDGKKVLENTLPSPLNRYVMNLGTLPAGLYELLIHTEKQSVIKKVIRR